MSPGLKKLLLAGVVVFLGIAAVVAVLYDSQRWAVLCVAGLQVVTLAAILGIGDRKGVAGGTEMSLGRIEQALENNSLRTVTESQAIVRELSSRLDDLGQRIDKS